MHNKEVNRWFMLYSAAQHIWEDLLMKSPDVNWNLFEELLDRKVKATDFEKQYIRRHMVDTEGIHWHYPTYRT
jgi:hypothetical protein